MPTWKRTAVYLWILLVFATVGTYLYFRGASDGVQKYKHSKQFQMALDSAYRYGLYDCKKGNDASNI